MSDKGLNKAFDRTVTSRPATSNQVIRQAVTTARGLLRRTLPGEGTRDEDDGRDEAQCRRKEEEVHGKEKVEQDVDDGHGELN